MDGRQRNTAPAFCKLMPSHHKQQGLVEMTIITDNIADRVSRQQRDCGSDSWFHEPRFTKNAKSCMCAFGSFFPPPEKHVLEHGSTTVSFLVKMRRTLTVRKKRGGSRCSVSLGAKWSAQFIITIRCLKGSSPNCVFSTLMFLLCFSLIIPTTETARRSVRRFGVSTGS
jgi:hypothetical protein